MMLWKKSTMLEYLKNRILIIYIYCFVFSFAHIFKASTTSKIFEKVAIGGGNSQKRVEFVKMKGPGVSHNFMTISYR